jgi:hypothetical protein
VRSVARNAPSATRLVGGFRGARRRQPGRRSQPRAAPQYVSERAQRTLSCRAGTPTPARVGGGVREPRSRGSRAASRLPPARSAPAECGLSCVEARRTITGLDGRVVGAVESALTDNDGGVASDHLELPARLSRAPSAPTLWRRRVQAAVVGPGALASPRGGRSRPFLAVVDAHWHRSRMNGLRLAERLSTSWAAHATYLAAEGTPHEGAKRRSFAAEQEGTDLSARRAGSESGDPDRRGGGDHGARRRHRPSRRATGPALTSSPKAGITEHEGAR